MASTSFILFRVVFHCSQSCGHEAIDIMKNSGHIGCYASHGKNPVFAADLVQGWTHFFWVSMRFLFWIENKNEHNFHCFATKQHKCLNLISGNPTTLWHHCSQNCDLPHMITQFGKTRVFLFFIFMLAIPISLENLF